MFHVHQVFLFSIPILFIFMILVLFYVFYLRRRQVDWSSLGMRISYSSSRISQSNHHDPLSTCELGLKKEVRERLPIVDNEEIYSMKDSSCSVCLVDYEFSSTLQRIPVCGHVFHMECIDYWLTSHTTCPLCRQCVLASSVKPPVPHLLTLQTNNIIIRSLILLQNSQAAHGNEEPQRDINETVHSRSHSEEEGRGSSEEEGRDLVVDSDREMSCLKSDMVRYKTTIN